MKTLDEHKAQLIEAVVKSDLPAEVKLICLDLLYERATARTIERARQAPTEQYDRFNVVRWVAGTNPGYAGQMFWDTLLWIEEAVHGHFISTAEDLSRWRGPVAETE